MIEISELEAEPSISHPHRRSWTRAPNRHSAPHYAKQRLRARPKPPLLIKGDHLLSDTVQAPTPATQEPPTNLDLGMSPLIIALLWFLGVCPGLALLGFVLGNSGQGGAVIAVIGMIPWAIASLYLGVALLVVLVTGGGINYNRAKAALRASKLSLSYYLRDHRGLNVIVVDEPKRLVCINGDVVSFDGIKSLSWESGAKHHQLEITLAGGAKPVRTIEMGTRPNLMNAFARLGNSLGFA